MAKRSANLFPSARLRPSTFVLAVCLSSLGILALPPEGVACGWWGEAGEDAGRDAVAVDRAGQATRGGAEDTDTPEALTRQANRLRRYGAAGYAGAVRLYHQAAEAGFAPAQNNLGAMYEEGLGAAPDLERAAHWHRRAAEQGEPHAQHSLGAMLLTGRGQIRDISQGLRWITAAARQGHASACADLGRFYATGEYGEKDVGQAIYWWQQAAHNGHPQAQQALVNLRRRNPR